MDNLQSAEERLLSPEHRGHEWDESHDIASLAASAGKWIEGHFAGQEFGGFLMTLLPSFALQSTRQQHKVIRSKLRHTSSLDGVRFVIQACKLPRDH